MSYGYSKIFYIVRLSHTDEQLRHYPSFQYFQVNLLDEWFVLVSSDPVCLENSNTLYLHEQGLNDNLGGV